VELFFRAVDCAIDVARAWHAHMKVDGTLGCCWNRLSIQADQEVAAVRWTVVRATSPEKADLPSHGTVAGNSAA
jgi:hypothetical protein